MENINENYTVNNCTVMGAATEKNFASLPKIKYFRVQSRGCVGKMSERHERKTGAWAVLVSLEGGNGLRLASDVLFEFGMVAKCEFKTKEAAYDAALEFKKKWGMPTSKAGKAREEAKKEVKTEVLDNVKQAMLAMGLKPEVVEVLMKNINK